ncbi:MAG: hypothetical protein HY763_11255 [Planctomycetes bacterium]|nr:hypothetical protein [Planctomycetota bacterium]
MDARRWGFGAGVFLIVGASPALGVRFELRPVACTAPHRIVGNEIVLPPGPALVTFEILLSEWGDDDDVCCKPCAWQATIDSSGYFGINAVPPNPGVDLNPLGNTTSCLQPMGSSPPGPCERERGAYQAVKWCSLNMRNCAPDSADPPISPCDPLTEGTCVDNPRYILASCDPFHATARVTLDYEFGASDQLLGCCNDVPTPDPSVDAATYGYCGTLALEVPPAARGVYRVNFVQDINKTSMNGGCSFLCPGMYTVPATITIAVPCCHSDGTCSTEVNEAACQAAGGSPLASVAFCDSDADGDGVNAVCGDGCPDDAMKIAPGQCGCGNTDMDADGDGTADCVDGCPNDPDKSVPGVCGCGVSDRDTDGDGVPDCAEDVPAVSAWGAVVLALLLLSAAKVAFRPRGRGIRSAP